MVPFFQNDTQRMEKGKRIQKIRAPAEITRGLFGSWLRHKLSFFASAFTELFSFPLRCLPWDITSSSLLYLQARWFGRHDEAHSIFEIIRRGRSAASRACVRFCLVGWSRLMPLGRSWFRGFRYRKVDRGILYVQKGNPIIISLSWSNTI